MADINRIKALRERLEQLSDSQIKVIENIIAQLEKEFDFARNTTSDLISECILQEFGDVLRIHHCFSAEAFTKDKFEYALEKVCVLCGVNAKLAPRGNAGHDITIKGTPISLKTQADSGIKEGSVYISKFMELGQGQWGTILMI